MNAIQNSAVGRRCVVCSHAERQNIEADLIEGTTSLRGIARRWGLGNEAVRRHVRAHVAPAAQEAMAAVAGLTPLGIATRMLDIADSARDVREDALEVGRAQLAVQAGRAEADALSRLADRLGVTSGQALADLHMMERVGAVMAQIARHDPETAELIAARFDQLDRPDIAADLRSLFQETTREALSA